MALRTVSFDESDAEFRVRVDPTFTCAKCGGRGEIIEAVYPEDVDDELATDLPSETEGPTYHRVRCPEGCEAAQSSPAPVRPIP